MRTYFRALLLSTCLTVSTACSASLFAQVQTMEKEADLIGVLQNGAAVNGLALRSKDRSRKSLRRLYPAKAGREYQRTDRRIRFDGTTRSPCRHHQRSYRKWSRQVELGEAQGYDATRQHSQWSC